MARDNKLDHLANVRLFSNLTKRELATVGRASDEISVDAGRLRAVARNSLQLV